MINVNQVELIGVVTCEPVFDETLNGTPVCKFLVATEDKFLDSTRASIHNISCIGKLCDNVARFCKKGSKVRVRGRLEYWADKSNNRLVDVKAEFVQFEN